MCDSQCVLGGKCGNNLWTTPSLCDASYQMQWQCLSRATSLYHAVDILRRTYVHSSSLLGGRPMVGLQTLHLAIGVRVAASQPTVSRQTGRSSFHRSGYPTRRSKIVLP